MLPARRQQGHRRRAQGEEPPEDGRHRTFGQVTKRKVGPLISRNLTFLLRLLRSLRQDLHAVQRAAHGHEEEDAREEKDAEPGLQRVVRL